MRRTTVAALLMLAMMSSGRPASAGSMTYLSLGDSVAFGETDFQNNPSAGNRGYVSRYAQYLAPMNGGVAPNVVNLAIDGETSTSFTTTSGRVATQAGISDPMLASFNTHYTDNPYVSQNTKFIQAVGNQMAMGNSIGAVTISLGADDLFALATSTAFKNASAAAQQAMLAQTLGTFATNYASLLNEVKVLLPNAKVSLLGEYNPFPATPNSPYAAFAAPAIQALNGVIQNLAGKYGYGYVDTYSAFVGHEAQYTLITTIPGDVHPNAQGYSVITAQIEAVPEPSCVAIFGLGFAALAYGVRRARR